MPSYNHQKYLPAAIDSVLGQSFEDLELIVIDDASTDDSRSLIEASAKKDTRLRPIFHRTNQGISETFNHGIDAAHGEFIAFLPSDDIWEKDKIKKQIKVLKEQDNMVVCSEGRVIDAEGNPTGELFTHTCKGPRGRNTKGKILKDLMWGNYVSIHSMIVKKANIADIRFDVNLRYLNDYKIAVELADRYEFFIIQEPLIRYRIHGTNSILSDRQGWTNDWSILRKYFLQKYYSQIPRKVKARMLFNLGCEAERSGDIKQARRNIIRAVMIYPFRFRYLRSLFTLDRKNLRRG
jgi:glycosyltransferase involved in cell wall biosynthesis